ncbi:LysR family transcriptional regulator [Frigidibacter sp.]|uniref:LysR family transcriptional regulator n=1 Tax=Frigidibacter sp. TaxID=2586418 RepID=UPI0027346A4C|nr:LysR family transcriptional regulator [Frigidibacter sp.]MDP3340823.1 LysR family transcriptional regulator [Frigidibacter sp.]
MQDINSFRVFLEVEAQRSFAGAARVLRMTPASVTRIVARLETDLGQQLLVRTTRQVSLTNAGAVVAARLRPIVEEFDRATHDITRAARPDRGRLAINAPMSFGLRVMPRMIHSFRLAYPHIQIDLQMTDALVDIVDASCDLAIRIARPPAVKSAIWRKICEVPRQLVAAPALFDRVARPGTPDDLDPDHCLSYSTGGSAEVWRLAKGARTRSLPAGTSVCTNNGEVLYSLAAAGDGIVNLPVFLVKDGLAKGEVVPVLTDWQITPLYLMLYYPPYERLPPLVSTFTDFFEAWVHDLDGFDFPTTPG